MVQVLGQKSFYADILRHANSEGLADLLSNLGLRLVSSYADNPVLVIVDHLQQWQQISGLRVHLWGIHRLIAGREERTGLVCLWKVASRAFNVSALSSLRFTSGSPVTSSTPGVLGGANFSWYDRPLAG